MVQERFSTSDLMVKWKCSRQNVSQLMKRFGQEPLMHRGYNGCSLFSAEAVEFVDKRKNTDLRPDCLRY